MAKRGKIEMGMWMLVLRLDWYQFEDLMRASCLKWFCHGNQYIGMPRYEQVTLLKLDEQKLQKKRS